MFEFFWRLLLILTICFNNGQANSKSREDVIIEMDEFKFVVANKDLVLKLNNFLPTRRQFYVEFMLSKNITQFNVKLMFDLIKKDKRIINLMSHDFDGCKLLQLAYSKVAAIKVSTAELFRTSNLPRKCPLLANKLYYIKNYTINAKDYPIMIPAMRWLVTLHFYIGRKLQGKMFIKGEVSKS